MDEENTKEEVQEDASEDADEGDKSETTPIIDRADKAAERLEAANKKQEELIVRQENIVAKEALGGRSDAGGKTEKKEMSPVEYAQALQKGEVNPLE